MKRTSSQWEDPVLYALEALGCCVFDATATAALPEEIRQGMHRRCLRCEVDRSRCPLSKAAQIRVRSSGQPPGPDTGRAG